MERNMLAFILIMVPLSFLVFIIGLVKPKWILFWMKEPDRLWASSMGLFLFMASWTLYSEMKLRQKTPGQPGHEEVQRSPEQQNALQLDRMR